MPVRGASPDQDCSKKNGTAMIREVQDEYGVYERLARLETWHPAMEARLVIVEKKLEQSDKDDDTDNRTTTAKFNFTLKELATWLIIGAVALNNGPQAIEIAKVLLK